MPGAAILAANAALRAGAGKLTLMTAKSVVGVVGAAVPEAQVIGLVETRTGGVTLKASRPLGDPFDAVLVGPGMQDEEAVVRLVDRLVLMVDTPRLILDALAMSVARTKGSSIAGKRRGHSILLTPHAGEMAHLTNLSKEQVCERPLDFAVDYAALWRVTIALKGATTYVATPGSHPWHHANRNAGLAVSGSGDVLAGIAAGLAARGAALPQAAVWSVALHAAAGDMLAHSLGSLGFLPRELPGQLPALLQSLSGSSKSTPARRRQ
jgi:hydroxyethylthiazole kinase-like uncharacterized protein yjeF